jgi:hypothetical protein
MQQSKINFRCIKENNRDIFNVSPKEETDR